MLKTIGIIDPTGIDYNGTNADERSLGGSETWVLNISKNLRRIGYHVIVFNGTKEWIFDNDLVEWIPLNEWHFRKEIINFEAIIVSRFYLHWIEDISNTGCTKKIFVQAHDVYIGGFVNDNELDVYPSSKELNNPLVKKIVGVSDYNLYLLNLYNKVPYDKMTVISNGVNIEEIDSAPEVEKRDNRILVSSRPERGLFMIVDHILDKVKKQIPDFGIDFATYADVPDEVLTNPDINYLGNLNKVQLYTEMKKHKVWFYPSAFVETFNISACETALCMNEHVLPYTHGMSSVFKYFIHTGMEYAYTSNDLKEISKEDFDKFINEAVEKIVKGIKEYDNSERASMRLAKRNYIADNYNWKVAAQKWKDLIEWS